MSDGINIEIIGNYKERYPAKIQSFSGENELIVKFDDNPEVLSNVPMKNVLLLLENSNNNKTSDYQVGCDVLAFLKIDDTNTSVAEFKDVNLTHAWWPAKIEKLKGCFAAIQLINKDNETCNDIVELTSLRLAHDSRPLLRSDIHIHEMTVPDELCEFCEHYNIRGDLIRWCGPAIVVNFDKIHKKLQIFSTQKEVVRKASLLDTPFMRVLRQKRLIHMQKDELTKRLNDSVRNQYTEEFTVAEEFMGLAIGSQGCNIKKARDIEGVLNIDLDDLTHTFVISAQTPEAGKAARAQLEYMKKIFYVPIDIVSKVIGRNGNQIQDIIDQSGIMRVRVVEGPDLQNWNDEENMSMLEDHVPFIFVGSANSIRDAGLLLEFSIDHHREMDRLQKERDDIHREIRNNQASANIPSKLTNYSGSERDDEHFNNQQNSRGYNSGGRTRGRGNYKMASSSDIEQRNDSYNDDPAIIGHQKYRGNGRVGGPPYRRGGAGSGSVGGGSGSGSGGGGSGSGSGGGGSGSGGAGSFRQGSLPPVVNGQHNGNRRFQPYDDETDDYQSATNETENGRGNHNKYRGGVNKPRGGGGGGSGRGRANNNNYNNHGKNQSKNAVQGEINEETKNGTGGGSGRGEPQVSVIGSVEGQ